MADLWNGEGGALSKFRDAFLDYLEDDRQESPGLESCRKNSAWRLNPSSGRSRRPVVWTYTPPGLRLTRSWPAGPLACWPRNNVRPPRGGLG